MPAGWVDLTQEKAVKMSIGYIIDEGDELSRDAKIKRLKVENTELKAKLEGMRNAAAIAIVALAIYDTSDQELDRVREMLENAIIDPQEQKDD